MTLVYETVDRSPVPGDLVKLKSGGPLMTYIKQVPVDGISFVLCKWFNKAGLQEGHFSKESLVVKELKK